MGIGMQGETDRESKQKKRGSINMGAGVTDESIICSQATPQHSQWASSVDHRLKAPFTTSLLSTTAHLYVQ